MINYDYYDQTKIGRDVHKAIYDYLYNYLLTQKNASVHTIRSYEKCLNSLLSFVAERRNCKTKELVFGDFGRESVLAYLNSMTEAKVSDSTRNQRRACICSFFSYVAAVCPTLEWQCLQIHKIPIRRQGQRSAEEVLSVGDINLLLNQVNGNPTITLRYRDKAIICMLYDTAARISELLGIKLKDLVLNRKDPYVVLHGKGKKIRRINLAPETVTVLTDYAKAYDINLSDYSDEPLFFCNHHSMRIPLHTDTIRRMLKRYEADIKQEVPSFTKSIHPHLLRASRATHLLSQGVNVCLISKFLGHSSIAITERYLRVDVDHIGEAIQHAAEDINNPLRIFLNPTRVGSNRVMEGGMAMC